MGKGRFTKLTDEQAELAFKSDKAILVLCSELKCSHKTLMSRWRKLFGDEEIALRKTRLKRAAISEVKPWEHVPSGEDHPMFGRSGERNPNWKGEEHSYECGGYRFIRAPQWWEGFSQGGWVREHQVVWAENNNATRVPVGMDIHHLDGNGLNNDPSNLVMLSRGEHSRIHLDEAPRDSLGRIRAHAQQG